MANFKSNYQVRGSIWNQTYFEKNGKSFVKRQAGASREQIMNDARFARTRENGSEFGNAAKAGKLLRYGFGSLVKSAADSQVTSRLTQVMYKIKNLDLESMRGERTVAVGIDSEQGKDLLIDFNFNSRAILKTVLNKPFTLDAATGMIAIKGIVPVNNIIVPEGTTNVEFTGAVGIIDFETGKYQTEYSNVVNLPYNLVAADVILTPGAFPGGKGTTFYMLHISFYQEINKVQYALKNGGFNALSIIEVK